MRPPALHTDLEAREGPPPPAIVAEHLTFQPDGPKGPTPIRDLSFAVPPGGALLVAGPTGAGKSMLLRIVAGLAGLYREPRASGTLVIADATKPQTTPLPEPRPGKVGFLFQEPGDGLLGLDVFTALALPLEEQGRPPWTTTRLVVDALDTYGIGHLATRDVTTLSGGERKRVALAGIEALDPPLVLLDEPLAHLDPHGVEQVLGDLRRLKHRRTVIVAEHRTAPLSPIVDRTLHLLGVDVPDVPAGPEPGVPTMTEPAPTIVARNLTVHRSERKVLDDVRLVLNPGVHALIGPNGAGKTTLLAALAGLVRPTAGDVSVDGVPVWRDGRSLRRARRVESTLRTRLQMTYQDAHEAFFAPTVVDELAAPLEALGIARKAEAHERAEAALSDAGLDALTARSPLRLSGGQARRVQTLGALIVGPRVLFLDEPTHGLDPQVRARLSATIEAFADAGGIVVVATHEPELVRPDAHWIFVPGDGSVLTGDAARPGAPGPLRAGFEEVTA